METANWTPRDWADHAVRQLPADALERYVRGYEGRTLRHHCGECAVGHMAAGGFLEGRKQYLGGEGFGNMHHHIQEQRGVAHPFAIIEFIFEGHYLGPDISISRAFDMPQDERRTLIYDACVEELAGRNSSDLAPTEAKATA